MATTQENLAAAFAGESQARNKYTFYAAIARKEGYHYIAKILDETADNEKRHAKDEFKLLDGLGGTAGGLGDTAANLRAAIEGEMHETTTMYPEFAKQAEAEGNKAAANLFRQIAKIEQHHAERYKKLLALVEAGTVFTRKEPITWKCSVCGFTHTGTEPPKKCPCCGHALEYFEPANLSFED